MAELKPCPFCGGEPRMRDQQVAEDCVETWVECECGVRMDPVEGAYSERPMAAAMWNQRAAARPAPFTEEQIDQLYLSKVAGRGPFDGIRSAFHAMVRTIEQAHGIGSAEVHAAEAELAEMRENGNADDATEAAAHLERVKRNDGVPAAPAPQPEKRAPVQGYAPGIPWSLHLEAYEAYCKKWAPQPALIDLEGRNCRGGFHVDELDVLVPGWRERALGVAPSEERKAKADGYKAWQAGERGGGL